ncbi:MAG TPA: ribonuclease H, partial [Candidatus Moranbacteria bacterium]|nr:ribonuclease H [Candidatus Moranbacteria bacterium]
MPNKIIIYTDGGSRGNPGPAAIGVWMETLNKKYGECIGEATNNVAEYSALIFGLKKL